MQRLIAVAGLLSILGPSNGSTQTPGTRTFEVSGRIVILEKGDKASPDLGDAVVYLEGPAAAAPAATARPLTIDIAITDKTYAPHVLVVPAGSSVRFPNHDPFNHNVFSLSEGNSFDLGLYGRGEAKSQTFLHPGLVRVYCNVHPRMVAYVQVMANRYFAQPNADGSFTIADVPPGSYRLHAWHERIPTELVTSITAGSAEPVQITLDARGYHLEPHRNKYGMNYPTNAGRERY
jgi:plastocyanin